MAVRPRLHYLILGSNAVVQQWETHPHTTHSIGMWNLLQYQPLKLKTLDYITCM